jgi:hypothetical protein
MKTVEITRENDSVTHLLEQAQDDDLLVRDPSGREYVVFAIEDFDQEVARTRKNEKLMALLDVRGKQQATIPLAEVKRQLGL